jgi:hypothetical protein
VAIHNGNLIAWATSAVPAHNSAVVMPNAAPLAAHATGVPGRRRPPSCPMIAPTRRRVRRGAARSLADGSQQRSHSIDRRQHHDR